MTGDQTAQFVVSIDLEMSWGAVHHGIPHDDRPYRAERDVVRDVLDAMERHRISATWAIVGHLFLAHCSPVDGVKHPEVTRPQYGWLEGDWYDLDPCTSVEMAPTWYGPDLVDAIKACSVHQEIGSHAFGHLIAGDPGCSPEAFRTDLEASQAAATSADVELRSFVFPRNSIGHIDVLESEGFTAFRGAPERFAGKPAWLKRTLAAADRIHPLESGTIHPSVQGRITNVPHTYMFNPDSTTALRFGTSVWSMMMQRRLRHAVRTSSMFHLWFHTHNLATNPDRARVGMDTLFSEARRLIDAGKLENMTMGQIADRIGSAS